MTKYEMMSINCLKEIRAKLERHMKDPNLSHAEFMKVVGYYVAAGTALRIAEGEVV